jgi:hypothetical protein
MLHMCAQVEFSNRGLLEIQLQKGLEFSNPSQNVIPLAPLAGRAHEVPRAQARAHACTQVCPREHARAGSRRFGLARAGARMPNTL